MAGETALTIVGNLTSDPELRFTPGGAAVCSFTVASTPRLLDKASNEWKDGDALFMRCSIWRQSAENVAESLQKGARVIVQGRLKQRKFTDKNGVERTVVELDVDEIGPSLRYATAKVARVERGGPTGGGPTGGVASGYGGGAAPTTWTPPAGYGAQQGGAQQGGAQRGYAGQQGGGSADPWSTPSYGDEPPF